MKRKNHFSAKASHYNKESTHYDAFNEENTQHINQTVEKILKKHKANTVLDLTCGTGLQVFYLSKRGYCVTGVDINHKMLAIAKRKAQQLKQPVTLMKGDMRSSRVGQFDAVMTIANAIGHLTKNDFVKTINNIQTNLNANGIYIFDIFNLNYLLANDNITRLTIDYQKKSGNVTAREIQYSTINQEGILASYDIYHEQKKNKPAKISGAFQTLQVYSAKQLKIMLKKGGFKVLRQCSINGSAFHETKTERILTIAQKRK